MDYFTFEILKSNGIALINQLHFGKYTTFLLVFACNDLVILY